MAKPPSAFEVQQLLSRRPAFRWLWQHHDEIAATISLPYQIKGVKLWAVLKRMAEADGVEVTRHALRQAWPMVETQWAAASPELRGALQAETKPSVDSPIEKPGSPKVERLSRPPEDDFSLPDITGKKI